MINLHYFIVNPVAGNGRAKNIFSELQKKLENMKTEYEFVFTEYEGHATQIAKEANAKGIKSIIAVGGDGTLLEVASGLFYSDCFFGIIPAGTGNDLIKALNIPANPLLALDIILKGNAKKIDAALCDDKPFLNTFGAGFDAQVVLQTNQTKKFMTGFPAYLLGLIIAFISYKPKMITVDSEELHIKQKMMFLNIANGRFIGSGIQVAPQAIIDDGSLDLVVVDKVSKLQVLKYFPAFMKGKHEKMFFLHKYKTKKAHISSSSPLIIQIDGEILMKDSVTVSIQEKALNVYVPTE